MCAVQCGLDGSKKVQTPMQTQQEVFKAQLELGKELRRPISVSNAAFLTCLLPLFACRRVFTQYRFFNYFKWIVVLRMFRDQVIQNSANFLKNQPLMMFMHHAPVDHFS